MSNLASVACSLPSGPSTILSIAQAELSIAQTMARNLHRCPDGKLGARIATISAALDAADRAAHLLVVHDTEYAVEGAGIHAAVLDLELALTATLDDAQIPTIVFCRDERTLCAALAENDPFLAPRRSTNLALVGTVA